jgi:hypothetical protein
MTAAATAGGGGPISPECRNPPSHLPPTSPLVRLHSCYAVSYGILFLLCKCVLHPVPDGC